MKAISRLLSLAGFGLFFFCAPLLPASQQLGGHVPAAVHDLNLQPVGRMAGSTMLHLSFGLPLRNKETLTDLLFRIYDPKSPQYHHYLTPAQFTERFGPAPAEYQSVVNFLKTNGMTAIEIDPGRKLVSVMARAGDIEKTCHVRMLLYNHPRESRQFFAPDVEPSLDLPAKVLAIGGLNDYTVPKPAGLSPDASPLGWPSGGSGPKGSLLSQDLRNAYVPNVSLTGAGQIIGLFERDLYYASDITAYEILNGISTGIPLINVPVGLVPGTPSTNSGTVGEVSLDIEMAIAMAPGVSQIRIYDGGLTSSPDDILSRICNENLANVVSISWSYAADASTENYFFQMAAQGQSVFQSSGDDGAYFDGVFTRFPHEGSPADDPWVTSVGGTMLTMSGPGGFRVSETTWSQFTTNSGTGISGSGGGFSTVFSIPTWQTNVDMSRNQGSTTMRNLPDVAMPAINLWVIANQGQSNAFNGTSCAAPLWAGFAALANEAAASHGKTNVGFLNPKLYSLCLGPAYSSLFHDITTGNNTNNFTTNRWFFAAPGYDLCTGWGSPKGMNLINALAVSDPLVILPSPDFFANGQPGGPFIPANQTYYLTNAGSNPIVWSANSLSSWLSVSPTNGQLSPNGGTQAITASLTAAATLSPGLFAGSIIVSNLTLHTEQLLESRLQVGLSPITFDELVASNSGGLTVLPGYAGLNWSNFLYINGLLYSGNPSGYHAAVVSPPNVVFNGTNNLGACGIFSTTPFDFLSAYVTAAWRDNLMLEAKGYAGGVVVFDQTNILSATAPALLTFNYYGIDRIDFIPSGGTTHQGYNGSGPEFAMDNILAIPHGGLIVPPTLVGVSHAGGVSEITWVAKLGQTYQLQFKSNLNQSTWISLGTPVTSAAAFLTLTNAAQGPQGFYRIQAIP